jgi:hypothetical protein
LIVTAKITKELMMLGYVNERGKPFSASSIAAMKEHVPIVRVAAS